MGSRVNQSPPSSVITCDRVTKIFSDQILFSDLNLSILQEESLVLIGPSGSGKSTFLRLIAGLERPTSGKITVGTDNVGMLFQKNALFDSLSVIDNLLFPLKERKGKTGTPARNQARSALEAVGLASAENLFPDEISGGMQKRLGIARALIVEPELILYDEPTAGLDPVTSRHIAQLILNLKQKTGSTLVTVTNDVQRALQLGTRICMLALGRWIEGGTPEQVRKSRDPALQQFLHGRAEGPLTPDL